MADEERHDGETILLIDVMSKRSQDKGVLASIIGSNFKERLFILTQSKLYYYEGNLEKLGKLKGSIELTNIRVIESLDAQAFSQKFVFQIIYDEDGSDWKLYVVAKSSDQQMKWITTLQTVCQGKGKLIPFYHSGAYSNNKWTCCGKSDKNIEGCKFTFLGEILRRNVVKARAVSEPSAAPIIKHTKDLRNPRSETTPNEIGRTASVSSDSAILGISQSLIVSSDEKLSISMESLKSGPCKVKYSFTSRVQGDLSVNKGEIVQVIDHSRENWWLVKNRQGIEGFIPSNYLEKLEGQGDQWYYSNVSRTQAEELLLADPNNLSLNGLYLIRKSKTRGFFALSVRNKGKVWNYQIKKDARERFYISEKIYFHTLQDLLDYYTHHDGGLTTKLSKPYTEEFIPVISELGRDIFEINRNDLQIGKQLGRGQFGVVYFGTYRNSIEVAVKMLKSDSMSEEDFLREAKVMHKLKHENLVQLYGICSIGKPLFIISEFMSRGCLLDYLREHFSSTTALSSQQTVEVLLNMALQICSAMLYLEENNFIHRDLAARNCLIGGTNIQIIKVADFGLAKCVIDSQYYLASEEAVFAVRWAAPEVLGYRKFSNKSDVWSFGVLLWELFTGGLRPYTELRNSEVARKVLKGHYLEKPEFCPMNIYNILRDCNSQEPTHRPKFEKLYRKLSKIIGASYPFIDVD